MSWRVLAYLAWGVALGFAGYFTPELGQAAKRHEVLFGLGMFGIGAAAGWRWRR